MRDAPNLVCLPRKPGVSLKFISALKQLSVANPLVVEDINIPGARLQIFCDPQKDQTHPVQPKKRLPPVSQSEPLGHRAGNVGRP